MKRYLMLTSALNIVLGLVISKMLIGYLNLSITNHYTGYIDTFCLLLVVFIIATLNYAIYKLMKANGKKIYIAVPTVVFMLTTSIMLFISC